MAQPKYPLIYDLQEPFRWIVDKTVLACAEDEIFNKTDFLLTDNYVLRLTPPAIKRLLEKLRLSLNSRVRYKGRSYSWDTVIQSKMQELTRYILERTDTLDLGNPKPEFDTEDSRLVREKILSLTSTQARKLGIGKSTLWYLQRRLQSSKTLLTYEKTKHRILKSSLVN